MLQEKAIEEMSERMNVHSPRQRHILEAGETNNTSIDEEQTVILTDEIASTLEVVQSTRLTGSSIPKASEQSGLENPEQQEAIQIAAIDEAADVLLQSQDLTMITELTDSSSSVDEDSDASDIIEDEGEEGDAIVERVEGQSPYKIDQPEDDGDTDLTLDNSTDKEPLSSNTREFFKRSKDSDYDSAHTSLDSDLQSMQLHYGIRILPRVTLGYHENITVSIHFSGRHLHVFPLSCLRLASQRSAPHLH